MDKLYQKYYNPQNTVDLKASIQRNIEDAVNELKENLKPTKKSEDALKTLNDELNKAWAITFGKMTEFEQILADLPKISELFVGLGDLFAIIRNGEVVFNKNGSDRVVALKFTTKDFYNINTLREIDWNSEKDKYGSHSWKDILSLPFCRSLLEKNKEDSKQIEKFRHYLKRLLELYAINFVHEVVGNRPSNLTFMNFESLPSSYQEHNYQITFKME